MVAPDCAKATALTSRQGTSVKLRNRKRRLGLIITACPRWKEALDPPGSADERWTIDVTVQHLRGAAFRQRSGPFASGATSLKNLRSIGSLFALIVMIHHYFPCCDRKFD
ncbi:hypothetical protein XAP6164_2810013 [Xanthomonas phaseoli pv. phaseoli]|nr:hypothetical protein XAP6164_2810013 [Xanthomonas phaseoli pv. phaseoli]